MSTPTKTTKLVRDIEFEGCYYADSGAYHVRPRYGTRRAGLGVRHQPTSRGPLLCWVVTYPDGRQVEFKTLKDVREQA